MEKKKRFKSNAISELDKEIEELRAQYAAFINEDKLKLFSSFPLSYKTLKGLSDSKLYHPTDIQRKCIIPILQGKDVLVSAITGSGKTLAFLIPILEHLYVNKWCRTDGIAAVIISPTRELAYQTFETLKKVGAYHDFSAGLIIGGKNLKFERCRMDQCNILICTPGRLLQHMDENPLFNASTMEMLVFDEADRCLDMGFEQTINAIITNFPTSRQTILFSATQTNSVNDLARLNMNHAVEIGNDIVCRTVVPDLLQQSYVVVPLQEKINMLWSFVKNHLNQKIIVFLSSCKQVKFIYQIFSKMRPGISLLALYGTLNQDRRLNIYNDFVRKSSVVLFATDIASRGLDFPAVNWVMQLDCPDGVTQYIHRAGRSARNKARGESLLVLLPSEENAMVEELNNRNIKIRKVHIDPNKLLSLRIKIEAFLAQNIELKQSAQRAFIAYVKSICFMSNIRIFRVRELDLDAFAKSLGLVNAPRVRFLERYFRKKPGINIENKNRSISDILHSNDSSDDDILKVKRVNHDIYSDNTTNDNSFVLPQKNDKLLTKVSLAKKLVKKKSQLNVKQYFDTEVMDADDSLEQENNWLGSVNSGIDIEAVKLLINEEDKKDKERFKTIVKQRHREKRVKSKNKKRDKDESEMNDSSDDDVIELPRLLTNKQSASGFNMKEKFIRLSNQSDAKVVKKAKINLRSAISDAEVVATELMAQSN
ncbi:probable ATP-dependent RNA helicase DDX10 [Teleopsis dalmanni]|uniref:probable ATP-dependent RNA helicase DDX10 n=1 Tax=Teleopsis dalmanni TaxID=139649 RepID=UPI0018CF0C9A|nr:probable ATP-dependent RNA helicase DDX10 [Teleopsis dalmanni]